MEAYYKYISVISNIPADSQMGLFTLAHFMNSVSHGVGGCSVEQYRHCRDFPLLGNFLWITLAHRARPSLIFLGTKYIFTISFSLLYL